MRRPPTATSKHPATVRRMADAIARITEGCGSCTEADLYRAGFTMAEVAAHGDDARDCAAERLRHLADAA